ncbi:MAG: hypothetical protein KDK59_08650 [Simkania sp.]|nr:hypothetical protein [Simkania sp.]
MKKFLWILLLPFSLFAAGPMTHLYFAEKWAEQNPIATQEALRDFVLGNLFPDIRYVANIPREWTHAEVYSIEEVGASRTPFEGGMKLHAFVDIVRENFVEKTGIYAYVIPYAEGHPATLLKFIEEEILADLFDGRKYSYCLDWIIQEELQFALTEDLVDHWHSRLRYCMNTRPSWLLWFASGQSRFGVPGNVIYNWSYLLPKLAQEPVFRNHVEQMLRHVESAIRGGYGIPVFTNLNGFK